jgi:hypothetical protein
VSQLWVRDPGSKLANERDGQSELLRLWCFPSIKWLGQLLNVDTVSSGKRTRDLRLRWEHFLHNTLLGMFCNFMIIFPQHTRAWESLTLLYETDPRHPVHANNADYVQGLLDGFFECSGRDSKPIFHVRRLGDRLQLFIFGPAAPALPLRFSHTFKAPPEKRTFLQPHEPGMPPSYYGQWSGLLLLGRTRKRKRVMYSDFRQYANTNTTLSCVLE